MKKPRPRGRPSKKVKKPYRVRIDRELLLRIATIDRFFREQYHDPDPHRRYLSLAALVERLNIPRSTLWKDFRTLRESFNAPLTVIKARGGWGYTENAPFLPNVLISEGDLTMLCASWGALERRRNTQWGERVRPLMEKLMTALNTDISFDFEAISERIVFRASGYHDAIDIGVFETVVSAVLGQRELKFHYGKPTRDGTPSITETRHVQPRVLICADHAWYIVTNDLDRDGQQRTFALFRMTEAEDTRIPFKPEKPIDLDKALKHSLCIHTGGEVAEVELCFKPAVAAFAREQYWNETEKFTKLPDGSLRLTLEVALNPELERRIHSYGSKVEVIRPPQLREHFIEYAKEHASMYLG